MSPGVVLHEFTLCLDVQQNTGLTFAAMPKTRYNRHDMFLLWPSHSLRYICVIIIYEAKVLVNDGKFCEDRRSYEIFTELTL